MISDAESPKIERKRSKKPLYAIAFSLWCEGKDLPEIARKTGLPLASLAEASQSQRWAQRRAMVADTQALEVVESRIHTQSRVDATLCRATEDAANALSASYVAIIRDIAGLSVDAEPEVENPAIVPTKGELRRQHVHLLREKIELQKLATEGLREMIATAQAVGLLKVDQRSARNGGPQAEDDKPIDLSKLTQLNIAIVQATKDRPAQVLAQLGNAQAAQAEPTDVTPV